MAFGASWVRSTSVTHGVSIRPGWPSSLAARRAVDAEGRAFGHAPHTRHTMIGLEEDQGKNHCDRDTVALRSGDDADPR